MRSAVPECLEDDYASQVSVEAGFVEDRGAEDCHRQRIRSEEAFGIEELADLANSLIELQRARPGTTGRGSLRNVRRILSIWWSSNH